MEVRRNSTVIMVMVDALRHDYITRSNAPFMHDLASSGLHGSLVPSFGFEPDGAYFSGLDPEECDGGAQYWHKPGEHVFRLLPLFRALHAIPSNSWRAMVRKMIRYTSQVLSADSMTRHMAPVNQIPLAMLGKFSFPMKKLASDPGFTTSYSIFDVLRKSGKTFLFHGHPAYSVRIEAVVERYLKDECGANDFAFLFVGDLDRIGHRYGPDSEQREEMLRRVDSGIGQIYARAASLYEEVHLVVFGDHGMVEVERYESLEETIRAAGLDMRKDLYFLDSTFARFWVEDPGRRAHLERLLDDLPFGRVISGADRARYRIRYPHNYFGDVLFAVDDAVLIHPSFYSTGRYPPKGMHGYLPGCRDNESAFFVASPRVGSPLAMGRMDMRRIYPTVLDLLGIMEGVDVPHDLKSLLT